VDFVADVLVELVVLDIDRCRSPIPDMSKTRSFNGFGPLGPLLRGGGLA
jgi:hypothetical protein